VVPAAEQQQVERTVGAGGVDQAVPGRIREVVAGVQLVHSPQHRPVGRVGPARVVRPARAERRDLVRRQRGALGEERDVDSPLVIGPAQRGRPVDRELPLAEGESRLPGQVVPSPPRDPARQVRAAGPGPEQGDRRPQELKRGGRRRVVRRFQRLDPHLLRIPRHDRHASIRALKTKAPSTRHRERTRRTPCPRHPHPPRRCRAGRSGDRRPAARSWRCWTCWAAAGRCG
jgi:hypothetical protein